MGYYKKSIQGMSWMGGFRVLSRAIAFGRIAILARLLTPGQFGLFGIAALALAFLEMFTSTGINVFLIQKQRKLEEYIDTAWIISIIRGTTIAILIFVGAPLIAKFFNAYESVGILRLISLVAFVRGFINPSRIKFQKTLQFNLEFRFISAVLIVDSIVAIMMTYVLNSPIGIVWGLLAGVVLEVILSFVLIKPIPKLSFQLEKAKKIIGVGKWITGTSMFSYLFTEGDDLFVGRFLKATSLGYYQMAYKISTLPITEITQVVNGVTFPVYANIGGDIKRLRKAFLKTLLITTILALPLGFLFIFWGSEIVNLVLGRDWMAIVPTLKILAVYGTIQSVLAISNALFLATNNQKYVMVCVFLNVLFLAIFIYPLTTRYGIVGAGYSVLASALLAAPARIYYSYKILK